MSGCGHSFAVGVARTFNYCAALAYLRVRAVPGMELVGITGYQRVVRIAGRAEVAVFDLSEVRSSGRILVVTQSGRGRDAMRLAVRGLFDLDADIDAVEDHLRKDPVLSSTVARQRGLRIPGATDPFELAVRAILGQQLSVARAASLAAGLAGALGVRLPGPQGGLRFAFPSPDALVDADLDFVRLPRPRVEAVRGLARAVVEGTVTFDTEVGPQRIAERLQAIPGIGPWTANYIALRALNCADAFPSADIGLRGAISKSGDLVSERVLRDKAEAWRPWRGYAALHLWTTLLPRAER